MRNNKIKIITTVGPSSFKESIIKKMDLAGVDLFRINLSHTKIENLEEYAIKLKSWTSKPICIDTEGAQLRTGELSSGKLKVETQDIIEFIKNEKTIIHNYQVPLSLNSIGEYFELGDLLKIDFNSVIAQIIEINNESAYARVLEGGIISSNKGIGLERSVRLPSFTDKDIKAFQIVEKLDLKYIALSFCSSAEDIKKLRSYFNFEINVISKIESIEGIKNLSDICRVSNSILIDRGDLSREIPIEKIVFAQNYIIENSKLLGIDVFVATNLMENMIKYSKPTRAEVHDIVGTLAGGASGLVLAAETAIGTYPVECVRTIDRIIDEYNSGVQKDTIGYLTIPTSDRIIQPHGGLLVQQYIREINFSDVDRLPIIDIDDNVLSDFVQIAEGTYSPLKGFMNLNELDSVLLENRLLDSTSWTLPIISQFKTENINKMPHSGDVAIRRKKDNQIYGILKIDNVEKIVSFDRVCKLWFGTNDLRHPGVVQFMNSGEYILSGKVYLIKRPNLSDMPHYELSPSQARNVINEMGWHNIIGFHSRNAVHVGHEFIQMKALQTTNADAIFISPVIGKKKTGDFTGHAIIMTYIEMIKRGYYKPYGAIIGAFNTYSRYSGPREAVFTAICRKNFGCNYFIVGRDHTGVGDFYKPNGSIEIFEKVDIGMEILTFDTVYYCDECNKSVDACSHKTQNHRKISGTLVREVLQTEGLEQYLLRPEVANLLREMYNRDVNSVFEP